MCWDGRAEKEDEETTSELRLGYNKTLAYMIPFLHSSALPFAPTTLSFNPPNFPTGLSNLLLKKLLLGLTSSSSSALSSACILDALREAEEDVM